MKVTIFPNSVGSQDKVASCCFHPRLMKKYRSILSATQINFIQSIPCYLAGELELPWDGMPLCLLSNDLQVIQVCIGVSLVQQWSQSCRSGMVRSESPTIGHMSRVDGGCVYTLHAEGYCVNLPDVYYGSGWRIRHDRTWQDYRYPNWSLE